MQVQEVLRLAWQLEQIFRTASHDLRTAQNELPLNSKHGARLQASEVNIKRGLEIISDIQAECSDRRIS